MDFKEIVLLAEIFLSSGMTTSDIEQHVGPVSDDSNPAGLILTGKHAFIERAKYGLVEEAGSLNPAYLFIKFNPARNIPLQQFIQHFGEARQGVRLKPDQPVPYVFGITGKDYGGELLAGYAADDSDWLVTVRISRLDPLE